LILDLTILAVAFAASVLLYPTLIRGFQRLRVRQPIQAELSSEHQRKKGTPTGGGILKSTNAGDTWIRTGAGLPPDKFVNTLTIDPVTTTTLYAVVFGAGIFKSTDGGANWNALDTGLASNGSIGSLVIDPTAPLTIYAVASIPPGPNGPFSQGIIKSTDGGQSWNVLNSLPPNSTIRSLVISASTPSVIYALAFLGANGPLSGATILSSADRGASWNVIDTGLPSGATVSTPVIDPTGKGMPQHCREAMGSPVAASGCPGIANLRTLPFHPHVSSAVSLDAPSSC